MNKFYLVFCLLASLPCFSQSEIIGDATPIDLQYGENQIRLADYFINAEIQSVASEIGLPFTLSDDKKLMTLHVENSIKQPLSNLTVTTKVGRYDLLVKSPISKIVNLTLADKKYTDVKIKGEMNSWNPNTTQVIKDQNANWVTQLTVNPGLYQYKYVVDGREICDPMNQDSVSNGVGGYNSLLKVNGIGEDKMPQLTAQSYTSEEIILNVTQEAGELYCYCNNQLLSYKADGDSRVIKVPTEGSDLQVSHLRCHAMSSGGGVSNDLVIPILNGKVVTDGSQLNRHDYRSQIMYFTLVDRFNNGTRSNDEPIDDNRLLPLTNYLGGDLEGITQKIESGYFDSLQINSIWLSPITQNPLKAYQEYIDPQYYYSGYHGYWPISSSKVDHRFGDDAALHRLVDVAHDHGINILLDYVTNHVHEEHPLYQNNPEFATNLMLSDSTYNLRIWDEQRLTTWFDTFLPSLDFSNPKVIEMQVDSTMYWLKKFGLDGYRHDATKHIPREFWVALTQRLKQEVCLKEGRSLYQIGETYGSRDLIKSYLSSGQLDAQFDFNLYFDAREVFAKEDQSFERLWQSMDQSLEYYGHHSMMGNITGNHDQARFISLASGDVRFDEDQKMAGFEREIEQSNAEGFAKHRMLLGFVMTIPGVPVIYYGDEIGMPGAGDPDSRRMMRFSELTQEEKQTKKLTQSLTQLRRTEMPLLYGNTELIEVSDDLLLFKRTYFGQSCYVIFNKSQETQEVILNDARNLISKLGTTRFITDDTNAVSIPPLSFDLITNY